MRPVLITPFRIGGGVWRLYNWITGQVYGRNMTEGEAVINAGYENDRMVAARRPRVNYDEHGNAV